MDDKEFNSLADATLAQIEHALEASEADIDFELAAGGVLEIEFEMAAKSSSIVIVLAEKYGSPPRLAVSTFGAMVKFGSILAMARS